MRQVRSCPTPLGAEGILWLDGESLCMTQGFWRELDGRVPDWLARAAQQGRSVVALPDGRRGLLECRRRDQPLRWLWSGLRRKPLVSAEVCRAGVLFRLARHGTPAPRLLAFGQRRPLPWRTESFLLTELPADGGGAS